MPQTSNSASAPYVTAQQFLLCYAPTIVADLLRPLTNPTGPPPSYMAMVDPTNPAGQKLLYHMGMGAGEIESKCAIAKRYSPLDLQALTGVSQILLQKLNAARGMWSLCSNLKPLTARPDEVPMAAESAAMLEELKNGDKIFTFFETEDAGLPSVVPARPNYLLTPNVVARAYRLFPDSQLGRNNQNGNGGAGGF